MTFFEDLEAAVTKYAKIIGEKAEQFVDSSANQINIYTQKDKVNKLYKKLGRYVYENRNSLGENEIGLILKEIEAEHTILDDMLAKQPESDAKPKYRVCTCGYKVRPDFEYCPKCGKRV